MYNIKEFRAKPDRLADFLVWAGLIAPGVVLNKDGSFQKSFRFRGPDLSSATENELIYVSAQINNVLKRLGSNWAIFAEAQRVKSEAYPQQDFPDMLCNFLDEERRQYFEGEHFENEFYFTLLYLPPKEMANKLDTMLITSEDKVKVDYSNHLQKFLAEFERVISLFQTVMPTAEALTDDETLTYLHSTVSPKRHLVKRPEIPMYLDAFLADTPLVAGLSPKFALGSTWVHLRTISIISFPGQSYPGIFDALNSLGFEYRWSTRFICMDKEDAKKELDMYEKKLFAGRKSMLTMVHEIFSGQESGREDKGAVTKANDAGEAVSELTSDFVAYGYYTTTIVVTDPNVEILENKIKSIETAINSLGFTTTVETTNAVDAWLGSLPGMTRANVRRPLLSTLNLSHMFPLSAVWAGQKFNKHLNAPALLFAETPDSTPFRLDLHVGDVGHTLIVGPTGAGKSVLLCTLAAQFRKYKNAQIYYFDKGGSSRVLTAGVDGDFYDLAKESEEALSFQPLANVDDENERTWAQEWLIEWFTSENLVITPSEKAAIWAALTSLAAAPKEQRTITGFRLLVQNLNLQQALEPLTVDGAFGRLFDSDKDNLPVGNWQVFEMEELMNLKAAVPPTLSYLFHKIEERLNGNPTLIILDEAWVFLDNPIFETKIREWLKVLRKKNASVVFATQNLEDIDGSKVAPAILNSCWTKIYLPNISARDDRPKKIYEKFGLNEAEISILSAAIPKRHYYYRSPLGRRLFELGLGSAQLAFFAASSPEDQKHMQELQDMGFTHDQVISEWYKYKKLPNVANIYNEFKEEIS